MIRERKKSAKLKLYSVYDVAESTYLQYRMAVIAIGHQAEIPGSR